jgi:adenosylcobyric acid synthase
VGFVVNRFRGRGELLADALAWTHRATGRPVLGTVPFLRDLGLPEEDSLSLGRDDTQPAVRTDSVEVVVIELPHLSNFTDFDALRAEPDVRLRFVRHAGDAGEPDLLVLPGSKNVIGDMAFVRESGWARAIRGLGENGRTEIAGLGGGLQMLGGSICDPHGLESAGTSVMGLGLLPITTTLERRKTLTRVRAVHAPSGLPVHGYEIHHGRSDRREAVPMVTRSDGEVIGVCTTQGRVWGTYLHGIFDGDEVRRWLIDGLRSRRGLAPLGECQARYDIEPAIQRLADTVRASIDVAALYREAGLR